MDSTACQRNGPFDRPQMDLMADLGAFFCPCVQLGLSKRKHQNDPS